MLHKNVGNSDRMIRIIIGLVLIGMALLGLGGGMIWLLVVIGVAMLATGVLTTCPVYSLLKINTKGK